ncbi:hypothetical protein GCM10007108_10250 [Thermogymnomonas acidicola]|uniref:HTH arsR-type domain-containing protein n=1 Tax=Thermogymnomonas acidicola TaxID=399579 RepID=A0AA37BRF6_9ARCH|nr:ArsR family transcriptional regulator [Thermogymnomonas acidicola]GGM74247.1 hypothetical protein GCM10007108_10250 [Thermogymnomonas acidicola]
MSQVLDQAVLSQLLIMMKIYEGENRPSELARSVGITSQGVLYHLRILKEKGYVYDDMRISPTGYEFLSSKLEELRQFVRDSLDRVGRQMVWECISDEHLEAGQKVTLYMKDGYLHARKYEGTGPVATCVASSAPGEPAGVSQLTGLIHVDIRAVEIIVIPDVGPEFRFDETVRRVRDEVKLGHGYLTGTVGESAYSVFLAAFGKRPDMEYGVLCAAFEASKRGVGTIILVSRKRMNFLLGELRSLQISSPEVPVRFKNLE